MGRRLALLIATYQYADDGLGRLTAPAHDAESLAAVLRDPDIAGFEVDILVNEPNHVVGAAVGEFYRKCRGDDLALLYFSGHGVKDDSGRLYLAMADTRRDNLLFSGLSAEQIDEAMTECMSRQKVLILDCCYSGAYPAGRSAKADREVHALDRFRGGGYTVLTASDSAQYSFEGEVLSGQAPQSVFTRHLVEGLRDGTADLDGDGDIALDELYSYVHDKVVEEMPQQRPKRKDDVQGRIVIARNIHWTLPGILSNAIRSPIAAERLDALDGLARLHRIGNDLVRQRVRDQIMALTVDDSRVVSEKATELARTLLALPPHTPPHQTPQQSAPQQSGPRPNQEPAGPSRGYETRGYGTSRHGTSGPTGTAAGPPAGVPSASPPWAPSPTARYAPPERESATPTEGSSHRSGGPVPSARRSPKPPKPQRPRSNGQVAARMWRRWWQGRRRTVLVVGVYIFGLLVAALIAIFHSGASGSGTPTSGCCATTMPRGVAVSTDGRELYVATPTGYSVIDTVTRRVSAGAVPIPAGVLGIAVSPDGARLYLVAAGSDRVTVVDTKTKATDSPIVIQGGGHVVSVATDASGGLYVARSGPDGFVKIPDPTASPANQVVTSLSGGAPLGIAVDLVGFQVYVAQSQQNRLQVFEMPSGLNIFGAPLITYMNVLKATAVVIGENRSVYVSSFDTRTVTVFAATDHAAPSRIFLLDASFGNGGGMAVSPDGSRLYVASPTGSSVSVFDTTTYAPIGNPISTSTGS